MRPAGPVISCLWCKIRGGRSVWTERDGQGYKRDSAYFVCYGTYTQRLVGDERVGVEKVGDDDMMMRTACCLWVMLCDGTLFRSSVLFICTSGERRPVTVSLKVAGETVDKLP